MQVTDSEKIEDPGVKAIQVIGKAASKIAPGRTPYFIEAHLVKALITIGSESPVGRIKLAKTLELSEGATRTLIKHLEKEKLIKTFRNGIILDKQGEKLCCSLTSKLSKAIEIPRSSLTVGSHNMAILVKEAANTVKSGLEQRDAAIKVGALGATTLIFSHGKLIMPTVKEDVVRNVSEVREALISELKPEENDVIIIGSADNRQAADLGALAAALETLKA